MAVVYKTAVTIGAVSANPPSFNLTLPTFASGNLAVDDIIIIMVLSKNLTLPANEINTPSGYTEKGTKTSVNGSVAADQGRTAMFYKRAVSGDDGASVTISRAGTSTLGLYAIAYVFRGAVNSGDPFDTAGISILGDTAADQDADFAAFDAVASSLHTIYFGWQYDDVTSNPTDLVNGSTFTFRNNQETATGSDATALLWSADHDGTALSATAKALTTTAGAFCGYVFGLLPGSQALTMSTTVGAFTLTGVAATLHAGRTLTAAVATFTETGVAATLHAGRTLTAAFGTFTETGIAATLARTWHLTADSGTFTETGNAANLAYGHLITADSGSFTLTGNAVSFPRTWHLTADSGSFALTGVASAFSTGRTVTAAVGTFVLTGNATAFSTGRTVTAAAGSFTLTGNAAAFPISHTIVGATGSFVLTGNATAFEIARSITAASGTFVLTGNDANLTIGSGGGTNYTITAASGSFVLTGNAVVFTRARNMTLASGTFVLTGRAVSLVKSGSESLYLTTDMQVLRYGLNIRNKKPDLRVLVPATTDLSRSIFIRNVNLGHVFIYNRNMQRIFDMQPFTELELIFTNDTVASMTISRLYLGTAGVA